MEAWITSRCMGLAEPAAPGAKLGAEPMGTIDKGGVAACRSKRATGSVLKPPIRAGGLSSRLPTMRMGLREATRAGWEASGTVGVLSLCSMDIRSSAQKAGARNRTEAECMRREENAEPN